MAGDQRQNGSFHSWINLWVTKKTVRSLANTCHSERFRGEFSRKALSKCPVFNFFFNFTIGLFWRFQAQAVWRPGFARTHTIGNLTAFLQTGYRGLKDMEAWEGRKREVEKRA